MWRLPKHSPHKPDGFTLVELMVSMVVLLLLAGIVFSLSNATGKIWKSTTAKIESFQSARFAFESMTRNIAQATLNTYWDYFDATGQPVTTGTISSYGRNSDLHFITGQAATLITSSTNWSHDGPATPARPTHAVFFVAPEGYTSGTTTNLQGLDKLLNASGYYIEFNSDRPNRPSFLSSVTSNLRYRYRLMELVQSSDRLQIYNSNYAVSKGSPAYNGWFNCALTIPPSGSPLANRPDSLPIADNIIALILQPKRSIAETVNSAGQTLQPISPDYTYDSRNQSTPSSPPSTQNLQRNQLPSYVQITMVALDETSALRLANGSTAPDLTSTAAVTAAGYTAFTNSSQYSSGNAASPQDLEKLEASLESKRLTYRVFTTNVVIKGAKWSEN